MKNLELETRNKHIENLYYFAHLWFCFWPCESSLCVLVLAFQNGALFYFIFFLSSFSKKGYLMHSLNSLGNEAKYELLNK